MTLAQTAYDLQLLTEGRFILGLGSQVKPHVERRSPCPGAARRRACASTYRRSGRSGRPGRTRPRCGSPGTLPAHPHDAVLRPRSAPIRPAARLPRGCRPRHDLVGGEVADGVTCMDSTPSGTSRSLDPGLARGQLAAEGADGACSVTLVGFVVSGDTDEELTLPRICPAADRLYGSTLPTDRARTAPLGRARGGLSIWPSGRRAWATMGSSSGRGVEEFA